MAAPRLDLDFEPGSLADRALGHGGKAEHQGIHLDSGERAEHHVDPGHAGHTMTRRFVDGGFHQGAGDRELVH